MVTFRSQSDGRFWERALEDSNLWPSASEDEGGALPSLESPPETRLRWARNGPRGHKTVTAIALLEAPAAAGAGKERKG